MRFEHDPQSSLGRSMHSRCCLGIDWSVESFYRALEIINGIFPAENWVAADVDQQLAQARSTPLTGKKIGGLLFINGGLITKPRLLVM